MNNAVDKEILAALFEGALDCTVLSRRLQIPVAEIEQRLQLLRQLGYQIDMQPHRGYTLSAAPDILVADEIQARLPDHRFVNQLLVYRETRSTNDLVFKAANDGVAEGFCVLAESQTHGKGRKGRVWQSAQNKGLWFSLLLRPDWPLAHAPHLTYLASVALCRAINKSAKLNCSIKWPNDVLINNRKVAGILTEIHGNGSRLNFAVLGIGCNVLHDAVDFPPELRDKVTSLKMNGADHDLRRADLLVSLLAELEMLYSRPWPEIYEQWKTLCLTIGKPVEVQTERGIISGQMVGLEENGHLLLRLPSGRVETIHSGDVLW